MLAASVWKEDVYLSNGDLNLTIPLIGRLSETDDGALALQTRARRPIPNEFREQEVTPEQLAAGDAIMSKAHPHAWLLCSSTLYNCGGMVFGARRVWIEPEHFHRILQDDGYRPVSDAQPGDVVIYGLSQESIDHAGVVHHTDLACLPERPDPVVWVRSKWGPHGEYVHKIDDVPENFGEPRHFYRFR